LSRVRNSYSISNQVQLTSRPSWVSSNLSRAIDSITLGKTSLLITTPTNHHLALPLHTSRKPRNSPLPTTSNLRLDHLPSKSPPTTLHHTTIGPPSPTPLCCPLRPPSATSHPATTLPGTMPRAPTPSATSSHLICPRSPQLLCRKLCAAVMSRSSGQLSMQGS
jgi:hypothetical protein